MLPDEPKHEPWTELTPEQARKLLDEAVKQGATVTQLSTTEHHFPGHSGTCTCADCMAMAEHVCACFNCKPLLLPEQQERLGPGHFGTRFGTDMVLTVFKEVNGELKALTDVVEVEVDQGWALRASMPGHLCRRCHRGVCVFLERGEFAVAFVHGEEFPK